MEILIYILAIIAAFALLARLYQRRIQNDDELNPVLPCVIEITDHSYLRGWDAASDSIYPIATFRSDEAIVFTEQKIYEDTIRRLREWGYRRTKWKCIPKMVQHAG